MIEDDDDDVATQQFRAKVAKMLDDLNNFIAEGDHIREVRPEIARAIAPDQFADAYAARQWAIQALAAIDAGDEVPPLP